MRFQKTHRVLSLEALRIPMWGYEVGYYCGNGETYQGYESPCGVMSINMQNRLLACFQLRIPMWGYELFSDAIRLYLQEVTNPHVGL